MPRIHCPAPLSADLPLRLPDAAARHVQVLRHQPGDLITLFNGEGGQWAARVTAMGKSTVDVQVLAHEAVERELARPVHLWVGLTANERMDWLIEKATELGVASITPVMAERSVLKLKGDRAQKRLDHWRAIAQAACEQCGRNRVPLVLDAAPLADLLKMPAHATPAHAARRAVLSLAADRQAFAQWLAQVDGWLDGCLGEPGGRGGQGDRGVAEPREGDANPGANPSVEPGVGPGAHHGAGIGRGDGGAGDDACAAAKPPVLFLSGPEGGLSAHEDALARAHGFAPISLGARILRAETAPLAVLSALALMD